MDVVFSLTIGLLAAALCAALTPLVRRVAIRAGIVDRPDGRRKLHKEPTPLGGGLAILASLFLVAAIAAFWSPSLRGGVLRHLPFLTGLASALVVIVSVGLLDDRFHLRGRQKLAGQILAAGILVASGLVVRRLQVFGIHVDLGLLAIPFTIFWLLGAINALNLIDGMDGLAGSVGLILSLTIAAIAWMSGREVDGFIALALGGAILGFLVHNLPPARIFLGDAGSMLIGLLLGALAIRSSIKGAATVALAAPTVIWAIPIFDVSMAIIRRKLTGRSIYETDRGHLHHCLQRSGYSGGGTVLFIAILCIVTCLGALLSVARQNESLAILAAAAVVATLVVGQIFGHGEVRLIGSRLKSMFLSLAQMPTGGPKQGVPQRSRLNGTRDWDELWTTLTVYAERFDLRSVQLNVNLPSLNEEYHATWRRRDGGPERLQWSTEIPLVAGGISVGRLRICGDPCEGAACTWMGELISGLRPFETQMVNLVLEELQKNAAAEGASLPPSAADVPA